MSLKINTNKIMQETKMLDKYIRDYNDNSYNIFNEISKLESYWKGKDASIFLEKINKEKNQTLLILSNMEKINNFYKQVETYYENIK